MSGLSEPEESGSGNAGSATVETDKHEPEAAMKPSASSLITPK